jgi:hypothetical protein
MPNEVPAPGEPLVDTHEKIQVLFKEYEALRSGILGRTNNGYQLWAIGAALLTFLMSRPLDVKFWILMSIFTVVFSLFSWTTFRDINKAAERLREIEGSINLLAGDELLQWETRWGSGVTGFFGKARPLKLRTPQRRHGKFSLGH